MAAVWGARGQHEVFEQVVAQYSSLTPVLLILACLIAAYVIF